MKDLLSFLIKETEIKKYKKPLLAILALLLIFEAVELLTPYITGLIIDNFIAGIDFGYVLQLILIVLFASLLSNFLYSVKERIDYKYFYFDLIRDLNKRGNEKLFSFSVGQHTAKNSGVKDSILSKGVSRIENLTRFFVYTLVPAFLTTLVTLIALFVIDYQIALVSLITFTCLIIFQWRLLKKVNPQLIEVEKLGQDVGKSIWNILHNIILVKNNGREKKALDIIDSDIVKRNDYEENVWTYYVVRLIRSGSFIIVGTTIVLIVSAWKINTGTLTPGMFVVVSMWSSMFFAGAYRFQGIYRTLANSVPAIQEYRDFIGIKPAIVSSKNALKPKDFKGSIVFENVSFSYPDEEGGDVVLKKVSFEIKPNEMIGVVGRSGSGKSTITKLLLRNYDPDKGSILIDGNKLKKIDVKHYLQNVGYVEQSTQLLDLSIRENLAFVTDKTLSEEDFKLALKQAGLLEFVEGLHNGLDTKIGEQGVKLSGGQRQRLAIARALIKKPVILILDEATASLDTEKEREIQEAIDNLAKENISATKIVIAHRLSTIVNADRIFVFDKGRLVDVGPHKELLERCDIYQTLYNLQHSHTV